MCHRLLFSSFAVALSLVLVGCAGPSASKGEKLASASKGFHEAIQFRDYRRAANLITEDLQANFLARAFGAEKSLSITEVEILSMTLDPDGKRAKSLSRVSYFELPSTTLHTENTTIDWVLVGAEWQIEGIEGGPLLLP